MLDKLENTVNQVKATIIQVSDERLTQIKEIQGYQFSGIGNAIHLVEHFSYHTGQIAFWVKMLKSKDLGFYSVGKEYMEDGIPHQRMFLDLIR